MRSSRKPFGSLLKDTKLVERRSPVQPQEKPLVFDVQSLESMGLTHRETEVLAWVAEGKTNSDIGIILEISSSTVKKHLEHIFLKVGVETRTAAVAFALRGIRSAARSKSLLRFGYFLTMYQLF